MNERLPTNTAPGAGSLEKLTQLELPLCQHLRAGIDAAGEQRIWRGIEAGLLVRSQGRSPRGGWAWAAVAVMVLLVGSGVLHALRPGLWETLRGQRELMLAQGGTFESVAGTASAARSVTLSDGSQIEAGAGALVEALASTPTDLSLVVRRGRVRFSVTPGGPRRWSIEARGTRVEVVGTVLSVDADERRVRVAVEVGVVVVRSPMLPDGMQRVAAGAMLELPAALATPAPNEPREHAEPSLTPAPTPLAPPPGLDTPGLDTTAPAPTRPTAAMSAQPAPSSPGTSEERGPAPATNAARLAAPAHASPQRAASARSARAAGARAHAMSPREEEAVRELWSRADEARAFGDASTAVQLLDRLLREHPADPRAPLAAYTLGTLLDAEPKDPSSATRAASAYRRALELGLPSALREPCYARLAAALFAAGDHDGVRSVVADYLAAYPRGERRDVLAKLALEATLRRARSQPPAAQP